MDSHIKGPRGDNGHGSIFSVSGFKVAFGDAAQTGKVLCKTTGATVKAPLLVKLRGLIPTAFDGSSPIFNLVETNLDGSGSVTIATIGGFTAGAFSLDKILTVDKIYKVVYTPATGTPTAGLGAYYVEPAGLGVLPV